jgi:hypothetical protein
MQLRQATYTTSIVRDRLVVGIANAQLSERLQMDSELTLKKQSTKYVNLRWCGSSKSH